MDWKHLFDSLGLNGTRWQWRMVRWQKSWQSWRESLGFRRRQVGRRYKFCGKCGAMLELNDAACVRCGARAGSASGVVVRRALGLVMPGWCPAYPVLVALNALVFIAALAPGWGDRLVKGGVMWALLMPAGEYWRLFTYGFLHANGLHLAMNMFALLQLGPMLEDEIGTSRFLAVYLLSILGGAAAVLFTGNPVLGASGALFGLLGFGLSYAHFLGGMRGGIMRNFFLHWVVYGFLFSLMPGISAAAHAGGFAAGAVLGFLVERERRLRERLTPWWRALAAVLSLAAAASFLWLVRQIL